MKKILNWLLLLPLLTAMMVGCNNEEDILFDVERPMFEIKSDAILLEVVLPRGTSLTDEYYIVGDFNGGEEAAIGDYRWLLEKATESNDKWGIYLYPSDFQNGKTLADGFYFYSLANGAEVDGKGDSIIHTLNVNVGTRSDIYVASWPTPEASDEIVHDGHVVYVENLTGWDNELKLYAWSGDGLPELFGGWPGTSATGKETVNGVEYTYFDMGDAHTGEANWNLIFNNNGAPQLADFNFEINRDVFLRLTPDGWKEIEPGAAQTFNIYVHNETGWAETVLYCYGAGEFCGGWPGSPSTDETKVVNGITYQQYTLPVEANYKTINLVFNNNGGGSHTPVPDFKMTVDRDYYLHVTTAGVTEIEDPDNYGVSYTVYVQDLTDWEGISVYAYGDLEACGGWPGKSPETELVNIDGIDYKAFPFSMAAKEKNLNLIFNNNGAGVQLPDYNLTLNRDYHLRVTSEGVVDIDLENAQMYTIYVNDQTGWAENALYCWGDLEACNGWPGMRPAETVEIAGVTYHAFKMSLEAAGKSLNLILNNNGAGEQKDGPNITLDRNYYFTVTADGWTENTAKIYVLDNTGWDALALYCWGDAEICGGWPGMQATGTEEVNGNTYKVFDLTPHFGKNENLIFNNNGAGAQFDGPNLTLVRDCYLDITASGFTEIQ